MFRRLTEQEIRRLRRRLLQWYRKSGRDLPWRHTVNPYAIVVSEVMLQQTQVSRVIPKYHAWLKQFPSVQSLASASLNDVLRLWSGLGYNSRALRLREMARVVVKKYYGRFPRRPRELLELPGFGPYTAAAVGAFAFGQPVVALDTNVRRVLIRHFWSGKKLPTERELSGLADRLLPIRRPANWNHALMDLGALVCPARRMCRNCPWQPYCRPAVKVSTSRPTQPFLRSNRFVRGQILRCVASQGSLRFERLKRQLQRQGIAGSRIRVALAGLVLDGLLYRSKGRISPAD